MKRVLLDENLPQKLRACLPGHDTATAVYMGFAGYKNGALLTAAENAGFDVIVTGDLTLEYEQNFAGRKIAVVSLSANSWKIIKDHVEKIGAAINRAEAGTFTRVDCGVFVRPKKPAPPI